MLLAIAGAAMAIQMVLLVVVSLMEIRQRRVLRR